MKLTLKKAKKDTDKIWKYLSTHEPHCNSCDANKLNAIKKLKINETHYRHPYCPLCGYHKQQKCYTVGAIYCEYCPLYKKYKIRCYDMGYDEYENNPSKENAKKFYDNIKECLK